MNAATLAPAMTAAFLAGLLGSGHCFGMCGGIAGSMGAIGGGSRGAALSSAVLFNFSRIASYGLLGAIVAVTLGAGGHALDVPSWAMWLRLVTAALILLIGLRYLFDWNTLGLLERAGAILWRRITPLAARASSGSGWRARCALGLCWGLLPCGLVYTVLLTAASTGSPVAGAAVMLGFGLGTLPSMLGLTLAAPSLAVFLQDRWTRRITGVALVGLSIWALVLAIGTPVQHGH